MVTWSPAAASGEPDEVLDTINAFFRGKKGLERMDAGGSDSPICAVAIGFPEDVDVNTFGSYLVNNLPQVLGDGWFDAQYLRRKGESFGAGPGWQSMAQSG
jgi:hypothetical protein